MWGVSFLLTEVLWMNTSYFEWSPDGRLLTRRSLGQIPESTKRACVLEVWICYKESEQPTDWTY